MSAHPRMAAIGVKIGVISPNRGKENRLSPDVRAEIYSGGGRGIRTPGPFGLRFSSSYPAVHHCAPRFASAEIIWVWCPAASAVVQQGPSGLAYSLAY